MADWCVRIVFLVVAIGRYAINKSIQHHHWAAYIRHMYASLV